MPNPPPEPLSPQREAEIRERADWCLAWVTDERHDARGKRVAHPRLTWESIGLIEEGVPTLLAEINRLRAEVERLTNEGIDSDAAEAMEQTWRAKYDAARADADNLRTRLDLVTGILTLEQMKWLAAKDEREAADIGPPPPGTKSTYWDEQGELERGMEC